MAVIADGTFDFCRKCDAHNNCCVRKRHNLGLVANPPLLAREVTEIAAVTGRQIAEFSEETAPVGNGLALKQTDIGCFFYEGGRCGIYNARPFDCRIFPFDIREIEGQLNWIVYTGLCPVSFEYESHFVSVKKILQAMKVEEAELRSFSRHGKETMDKHVFKLLEPVAIDVFVGSCS